MAGRRAQLVKAEIQLQGQQKEMLEMSETAMTAKNFWKQRAWMERQRAEDAIAEARRVQILEASSIHECAAMTEELAKTRAQLDQQIQQLSTQPP